MKFPRKRKPLEGIIHDPPHEPTHRNGRAYNATQIGTKVHEALEAYILSSEPDPVPEAIIENPKPYRGAVAKSVEQKMIRESVKNTLELTAMGAHEQAWTQLWSNFTKICFAVGVPVDTNADLRIH